MRKGEEELEQRTAETQEQGFCGVFREDVAEALHVSDMVCRRIVRTMQNPAQSNATMLTPFTTSLWCATPRPRKKPLPLRSGRQRGRQRGRQWRQQ